MRYTTKLKRNVPSCDHIVLEDTLEFTSESVVGAKHKATSWARKHEITNNFSIDSDWATILRWCNYRNRYIETDSFIRSEKDNDMYSPYLKLIPIE